MKWMERCICQRVSKSGVNGWNVASIKECQRVVSRSYGEGDRREDLDRG